MRMSIKDRAQLCKHPGQRNTETWVLSHHRRGSNPVCPDSSVLCHKVWALSLLIFLLWSLLITFPPLREIVLLPFSLLSLSLHQIDNRSLSKSLSNHSLWFFTIIPHLFCPNFFLFPSLPFNSYLLSWVSHLSVSLISPFLPVSRMSLSLLSRCLSLPNFSRNLSLDCSSLPP